MAIGPPQQMNTSTKDRCWIVWESGDPNSYRCFNCETAEEAAGEYHKKYGHRGRYSLTVSELYRHDTDPISFEVTFEIKKK